MRKRVLAASIGWLGFIVMSQIHADTIHITSLQQLQAINCNSTNSYILDNNIIPGTVTAINPICGNGNPFQGTFDGQNHIIANLKITQQSQYSPIGLFGQIGSSGEIQNLNLNSINIDNITNTQVYAGTLAGFNNGKIDNVTSTKGTVNDPNGLHDGGLVGENDGTISNSYANVAINFSNQAQSEKAGGFVGENEGTITESASLSTLTDNKSQACIRTGGFVGENGGTISNCYSQGNIVVTTTVFTSAIGGFAGLGGGNIANVYSISHVTATAGTNIGGLIGQLSGTIANSYWNTQTSGQTQGVGNISPDPAGVNGRTTAQMQQRSTYAGWDINPADINAIWSIFDNATYPFFRKQQIFISGCIKNTDSPQTNDSAKVKLAVNGTPLPDDAEISAVGDCYVYVIHKGDLTLGNALLLYITDSSLVGNTVFIPHNDTQDINNLDIYVNRVSLVSNGDFNNNHLFAEAKGNLTDGILYQTNDQGSFKINAPKLDVKVNGSSALSGTIGDGCKTAQEIAQRVFIINSPINPGTQYINAVDLYRYHAGSL